MNGCTEIYYNQHKQSQETWHFPLLDLSLLISGGKSFVVVFF